MFKVPGSKFSSNIIDFWLNPVFTQAKEVRQRKEKSRKTVKMHSIIFTLYFKAFLLMKGCLSPGRLFSLMLIFLKKLTVGLKKKT